MSLWSDAGPCLVRVLHHAGSRQRVPGPGPLQAGEAGNQAVQEGQGDDTRNEAVSGDDQPQLAAVCLGQLHADTLITLDRQLAHADRRLRRRDRRAGVRARSAAGIARRSSLHVRRLPPDPRINSRFPRASAAGTFAVPRRGQSVRARRDTRPPLVQSHSVLRARCALGRNSGLGVQVPRRRTPADAAGIPACLSQRHINMQRKQITICRGNRTRWIPPCRAA